MSVVISLKKFCKLKNAPKLFAADILIALGGKALFGRRERESRAPTSIL